MIDGSWYAMEVILCRIHNVMATLPGSRQPPIHYVDQSGGPLPVERYRALRMCRSLAFSSRLQRGRGSRRSAHGPPLLVPVVRRVQGGSRGGREGEPASRVEGDGGALDPCERPRFESFGQAFGGVALRVHQPVDGRQCIIEARSLS